MEENPSVYGRKDWNRARHDARQRAKGAMSAAQIARWTEGVTGR
jgi:hypothetical protein